MKSITFNRLATLFFVSVLTIGAGSVMAKPHHGGEGAPHGMMVHRMLKNLDLTEAQQSQIKALTEKFRATQPQRDAKMAERDQLQALVKADTFDSTAARILLEKQQAARIEQQLTALQYMHDVRAVLTPEQKAKMDEKVAKMQQRAKERRAEAQDK